jgi:hypothetical protein
MVLAMSFCADVYVVLQFSTRYFHLHYSYNKPHGIALTCMRPVNAPPWRDHTRIVRKIRAHVRKGREGNDDELRIFLNSCDQLKNDLYY